MSAKFAKLKTVEPIAPAALEALHTGTLIERLNRLRQLHDSYEASDWSAEERDAVEAAGLIAFKDSARWRAAVAEVKHVLSGREHLPRGSREKRQQAAHRKQNR